MVDRILSPLPSRQRTYVGLMVLTLLVCESPRSWGPVVALAFVAGLLAILRPHLVASTRGVVGATHADESAIAIRESRFVLLALGTPPMVFGAWIAMRGAWSSPVVFEYCVIALPIALATNLAAVIRTRWSVGAGVAFAKAAACSLAIGGGVVRLLASESMRMAWRALSSGSIVAGCWLLAVVVFGGVRLLIKRPRLASVAG